MLGLIYEFLTWLNPTAVHETVMIFVPAVVIGLFLGAAAHFATRSMGRRR